MTTDNTLAGRAKASLHAEAARIVRQCKIGIVVFATAAISIVAIAGSHPVGLFLTTVCCATCAVLASAICYVRRSDHDLKEFGSSGDRRPRGVNETTSIARRLFT